MLKFDVFCDKMKMIICNFSFERVAIIVMKKESNKRDDAFEFTGEIFSGEPIQTSAENENIDISEFAQRANYNPTQKRKKEKHTSKLKVFNNNEPVSFAVVKMVKEMLFLLVFVMVVVGILISYNQVWALSTNDSVYYITEDEVYNQSYQLELTAVSRENSVDFVIDTFSAYFALSKPEVEYDLISAADTQKVLDDWLSNYKVDVYENLNNYRYIEKIYESLGSGLPVIFMYFDDESNSVEYALITGINPHEDQITVMYNNGASETTTLDEFLAKTRYEEEGSENIMFDIYLSLGLYNRNTAIFMYEEGIN